MLMLEFDQFFHTDEKCEATVAGFLNFKKAKALVEIWFPMIKVLKMYALNDQNDERTIHSKKKKGFPEQKEIMRDVDGVWVCVELYSDQLIMCLK